MSGRVRKWINRRWPLSATLRWGLVEEIPGGPRWAYCFGALNLLVFAVLIITGILQLLFYVPTVDHAYDSVLYLRRQVAFGWLVHGLHYWAAQAFVVLVGLHMIRVFIWGAYKKPRELTWISGVLLLLLVAALSFTGPALAWDQLGYWASEVGTSIPGTVPLIGDFLERMIRGSETMGQETLSRFFVLHVAVLPGTLMLIFIIHLVAFRQFGSVGPWNERKRARPGWFWPDQVAMDVLAVVGMLLLLVALSAYWPAPISGPADPLDSSVTPKPEWNFLFLYQALKAFEGPWEPVGTALLPLLLTLILLLLPFYDRNRERSPGRRPVAMAGGVVFVAGVLVLTLWGHLSNPGAVQGGQPPSSPGGGDSPAATRQALSPEARAGKELFGQNCMACHAIDGQGGSVGPDLSKEGSKRSRSWIDTQIRDPKKHDPASVMPPFESLGDGKISQLAAYLASLGGSTSSGGPGETATQSSQPAETQPAETQPAAAEGGPTTSSQPAASAAKTATQPAAAAPSAAAGIPRSGHQGPPGEAARMVANWQHGGVLFRQECMQCHGPRGTDHVPNPGSDDGTVPPLAPIDPELASADPKVFAASIDRFIQHGSIADGPDPALHMPDFGDSRSLTQAQIANIEAYILHLNGVDRAELIHPGMAPGLFFLVLVIVTGAAGLAVAILWLARKGATSRSQEEALDTPLPIAPEPSRVEDSDEADEEEDALPDAGETAEYVRELAEAERALRGRSAKRAQAYFALIVLCTVAVVGAAVSLIFSQFVTSKPLPNVPASAPARPAAVRPAEQTRAADPPVPPAERPLAARETDPDGGGAG